jgi:hypothetical protein
MAGRSKESSKNGIGSGNHNTLRAAPAKLSQKALGSLELCALLGLSLEDSAALLRRVEHAPPECPNFCARTLKRMRDRDPEVAEAIAHGRSLGRYRVAQSIYEMATQRDNLAAAIYWEKTRNAPLLAKAEALYDHVKAEDSAEYLNERFEKAVGDSSPSMEELESMTEEEFEADLARVVQAKLLEQG